MKKSVGFVLPTVVVSSIVLMTVLLAALQLASSSAAALRDQYYNTLAREAAEAGAVFMGECMKERYFDTTKTVRPGTDCLGVSRGSMSTVYRSGNLQTTFEGSYKMIGQNRVAIVVGKSQLRRPDGSGPYKQYEYTAKQHITKEHSSSDSKASKRWWYFGHNARLDFGVNGSYPTASAIGNRPEQSNEGVTTVSDRKGNLLFFSDGLNIWDRNGNLMPVASWSANYNQHCDDLPGKFPLKSQGLCGSVTATQAVASFPIDKEETKYIVVANTANAGDKAKYGTLYWSMIAFDNANPNGQIVLRNLAVAPDGMKNYASEALNARPNEAGNGGIIYTYRQTNPNELYAFGLWTENNGSNIISGQHPVYGGTRRNIILNRQQFTGVSPSRTRSCGSDAAAFTGTGFGSVNFNHDYTRMVLLMGSNNHPSCQAWEYAGVVKVFDVSGDATLNQLHQWAVEKPNETRGSGYSADFSPSGRYVYTASIYPGRLYRYDLNAGNDAAIKQSERFIGKTACNEYVGSGKKGTRCAEIEPWRTHPPGGGGQVLRGPDGRMYVADRGSKHISVIDNPDADNGYNDTQTAVNIRWRYAGLSIPGNGYSFYGLPQMVTLYSPRLIQY